MFLIWRGLVAKDGDLGCGGLVVVGFLLMFIVGLFSNIADDLALNAPDVPVVAKTDEELRLDKISRGFSAVNGSHIRLARWVKKRLRDPGSYEHIETRYIDVGDHLIVTLKYRAKNGFGGFSVESVTAKALIDGTLTEIVSAP